MARILAISSQVARGAVGLSVVVPALQAMGHEVIGLPTVLLSNHPGHACVSGTQVASEVLRGVLGALEANGWLPGIDGVLTGYLPSVAHVAFAAEALAAVKRSSHGAVYLCDPVMGDDPKGLYIAEDAARAIASKLVQSAQIATPNHFEAEFISSVTGASAGGERLTQVTTSVRGALAGELVNRLTCDGRTFATRVPVRADAPHGTGDLFAALYLGRFLERRDNVDALGFATAGVDATLAASGGRDVLSLHALMPHPPHWVNWPVEG